MSAWLPLGFAQPWLLLGLLALPAVWWLLRITPPAPMRRPFPPAAILARLASREDTPAHTPLWLLLLRMAILALLVLAASGPVWNPQPLLAGAETVVLVVDDGFETAADWSARLRPLEELLARADREGREAVLVTTAPARAGIRIVRGLPARLRALARELAPRPWPADRRATARALAGLEIGDAEVHWLLSPWTVPGEGAEAVAELAARLRRLGPLTVYRPGGPPPVWLVPPAEPGVPRVRAERAVAGPAATVTAVAFGPEGEGLARVTLAFAEGERVAEAALDLPLEMRNRIARLELAGIPGAASVVLFDERWRRRVVGLFGARAGGEDQPLLSDLHYVARALAPWAEIRRGDLDRLLAGPVSVMVLADVGRLPEAEVARLRTWIERGGVVLRFAGPRLAAGGDALLPVRLRRGERTLGAALTWSRPLAFAPFPEDGPFAGLAVDPQVRVRRQVLAEPSPELAAHTLAALEDGTPVVTGRRLGRGWLLLVHTTANPTWSDLALSRMFLDMLRRVLDLAAGSGGPVRGPLVADRILDGFGRLRPAPAGLAPVEAAARGRRPVGPDFPPGLWRPAGREGAAAVAVNLQDTVRTLLPALPRNADRVRGLVAEVERPLAPWLFAAALLLALVDLAASLRLRGLLPAGTATVVLVLVLSGPSAAGAQPLPDPAVLAAETRFAWVRTGIPEVDRKSEAGLRGLSLILALRTAVEPADPVGVDPARDELALFPLLYWPVPPEHPDLAPGTLERVQRYLDRGGMILFDTGDAGLLLPGESGGGPGERRFRELFGELDLPPLEPVPSDHALTRAFYLLRDFPGRFIGLPLWVDRPRPGVNDGVSSVLIGGHDWAGAWAIDELGEPLFPVVPGGEHQREMARRFGVNLAMYALTGNYKTDQVHVPAILERLGQ